MPATPSAELRRRLRARARRVSILRRRIGALTIALFLGAWTTIAAAGLEGHSGSTEVALVHARAHAASAHASATAASSGSTAATAPTSVTTRQS